MVGHRKVVQIRHVRRNQQDKRPYQRRGDAQRAPEEAKERPCRPRLHEDSQQPQRGQRRESVVEQRRWQGNEIRERGPYVPIHLVRKGAIDDRLRHYKQAYLVRTHRGTEGLCPKQECREDGYGKRDKFHPGVLDQPSPPACYGHCRPASGTSSRRTKIASVEKRFSGA